MSGRRTLGVAQVPSDEALMSEVAGARAAAHALPVEGPSAEALRDLRARVTDRIACEVGVVARLRALSNRAQLALSLALVGIAVLGVIARAPRAELHHAWQVPVAIAVVLALGGGACVSHFLRPLHRSGDGRRIGALVLAFAVGGSLAMVIARAAEPALSPTFARDCGSCVTFGCAAAAPLWLFTLAARRHSASGWLGVMLVGAGAGLIGQGLLELHCPIVSRGHHLLGHFTIIPVFALAAFAFLRRLFSTR